MPGPKLPEYPKPMFKRDVDPMYARNEKHEDELAAQGWSVAYIPRQYPRMLFWPNERKFLTVATMDAEVEALEKGWSRESQPCHYGEHDTKPIIALPTAPAVSDELSQLREMFVEQQKLINSLLLEKAGSGDDDDIPAGRRARK